MSKQLELSEVIIVKICHDLAGTIGAVNNGLELLQDNNAHIHEQSLKLVESSAREAVNKLVYFRQAYGSSSSEGEANIENLKILVSNYFGSSNIKIDWNIKDNSQSLSSLEAKILLNIILVGAAALALGGNIKIDLQKDLNKMLFKLHGEGKMVRLAEDVIDILNGKSTNHAINVKNVQAYMAACLVEKFKRGLKLEHDANHITLIVN